MSIITEIGKAFMLGIITFFGLGVAARALPWHLAKTVADTYVGMGMACLGRGLLIQRAHGGLTLKKTTFDSSVSGEKARISGNIKQWSDPHNMMSRFQGRPFGLAHETSNTILDARTLALARRFRELDRRGEWEVDGRFRAFFHVEEGDSTDLVDIADGLSVVQHSEAPGLVDRLKEFVRKSQMMFNAPRLMQHSAWLIALGVGFGLMFLANRLADTSGGSTGSPIPLTVAFDVMGVAL